MSKKETPTGAETSAGARAETAACGRAAISYQHFSTDKVSGQPAIADRLGHGREAAVPLQHLVMLTGESSREVRRQIERARRSGALVVADCKAGYWLSDDMTEVQRCVRSMRGRAHEILLTARALEVAAHLD